MALHEEYTVWICLPEAELDELAKQAGLDREAPWPWTDENNAAEEKFEELERQALDKASEEVMAAVRASKYVPEVDFKGREQY